MVHLAPFRPLSKAILRLRQQPILVKAMSFGLIGVINGLVDASVFLLARAAMIASGAVIDFAAALAAACACAAPATPIAIAANVLSWSVAVSGSYVLNSSITFAVESGRRLRCKDYARFVASGLFGLLANTATLVATDDFLPIWAAKGCAILAGFVINFGLTHFVVFRAHRF